MKEGLFSGIPTQLRAELVDAYNRIVTNYRERRWEPSELNGGKLCEVVYSILHGYTTNSFPQSASKPSNFLQACHNLEQVGSTFPRSIRIQIPRMLIALYEIRDNRNVGHVGADVDPNEMDATCVLYMAKWIMAELARVFHTLSIEEAEQAVHELVEKIVPSLWEVDGKVRVLHPSLSMKEKTLLILYGAEGPLAEADLRQWVEHSNGSVYRRDVLRPAHKKKLIEYDQRSELVHLSPRGTDEVEMSILPKVAGTQ